VGPWQTAKKTGRVCSSPEVVGFLKARPTSRSAHVGPRVQTHEEIKPVKLEYCLSCPCAPAGTEIVRSLLPNNQGGQADRVFGARHTTRRSLPDTRHAGWRGQSVAVMDDHSFLFGVWSLEFGISGLRTMDFDFLYLVVNIYGVGRAAVVLCAQFAMVTW
jgi:hypothetical protein